jgi:Tfp pilus assembly protein PilF
VSRLVVSILSLALAAGCASWSGPPRAEPFRISDVAAQGDATRRASTRLVLRGLEADAGPDRGRARALYQRALQVDPTNPYAFLALARQAAERGDAAGVSYVDQAQTLLALEEAPEGAHLHARGLRGVLERRSELLREVGARAPESWADGRLDARELR